MSVIDGFFSGSRWSDNRTDKQKMEKRPQNPISSILWLVRICRMEIDGIWSPDNDPDQRPVVHDPDQHIYIP